MNRIACCPYASMKLDGLEFHMLRSFRSSCGSLHDEDPVLQKKSDTSRSLKVAGIIQSYVKETKEFQGLLKSETEEFNLGRRFLANMMGIPVTRMSQRNIDRSISYLFPSGLFHIKAKPVMKPPVEICPVRKDLECDANGRPFHTLFYNQSPRFFEIIQKASTFIESLKKYEDELLRKGVTSRSRRNLSSKLLLGSRWMTKDELKKKTLEHITDEQYQRWLSVLDFLASMPAASSNAVIVEFLMKNRISRGVSSSNLGLPPVQLCSETQRYFSSAYGQKKNSLATVKLFEAGTGSFSVNNSSLLDWFPNIADRENILTPLAFTERVGKVDVVATVYVPGVDPKYQLQHMGGKNLSSQSSALRLALTRALSCFLHQADLEKLRQSGLLTLDMRFRERFYPGMEGARKKWTWKAR